MSGIDCFTWFIGKKCDIHTHSRINTHEQKTCRLFRIRHNVWCGNLPIQWTCVEIPSKLISWHFCGVLFSVFFGGNLPKFTLPETNNSPLKIGHPKRTGAYSNHPFSGANLLLVSGRVTSKNHGSTWKKCRSSVSFVTKSSVRFWHLEFGSHLGR